MTNGRNTWERLPDGRIRLVYLIGSLETGGAEAQLLLLLAGLNRSKFDPRLVLFNWNGCNGHQSGAGDVFSLEIPSAGNAKWRAKGWGASKAMLRLSRHLAQLKPDIIHSFLPAACIIGTIAGRLARVPVIVGSRRSLVNAYRPSSRVAALADRYATKHADFMTGNSDAVARELIEVDGLPRERVRTIYNGVDTARFHPGVNGGWRAELGWNGDHVVFGMVANFIPYKRHVDFVRAAAIVRQKFPRARFVMAGEDRGALPEVRREIENLKLGDVVTVVPGMREPEKLYAALDAYICSSETEGLSNVLLEAMACGKPVIATDVGGNPEVVVANETGVLVPAKSPAAMAEAAVSLAVSAERRKEFGARGRRRTEEIFSVGKMVAAHSELYMRATHACRGEARG